MHTSHSPRTPLLFAISGLLMTSAHGVWESTLAVKRLQHTKRLPTSPTAFTNRAAVRMATTLKIGCVLNSNSSNHYE